MGVPATPRLVAAERQGPSHGGAPRSGGREPASADAELPHGAGQALGLVLQAAGGGRAFFHQGCVLLRHLVEVADRAAHLRDAHYAGAAQLGHGTDYVYPHDVDGGVAQQQYLPDLLADRTYYRPTRHGAEAAWGDIAQRLERARKAHD